MSYPKLVVVPSIVLSALLTFAPIFAQEAGTGGGQAGNTGAPAQSPDTARGSRGDLGLLGLIGLLGLGGLMRRGRESLSSSDRPSNR